MREIVFALVEAEIDGLFALHHDEKALQRRKMATLFPGGHPWDQRWVRGAGEVRRFGVLQPDRLLRSLSYR